MAYDLVRRIGLWILDHWLVCVVGLLALCQLPMTITHLCEKPTTIQTIARSDSKTSQEEKPKVQPPILPSRKDPFAPLPPTDAGTMKTTDTLPAMANALAGTGIPGSLPPLNPVSQAKIPPPSALLKPSPRSPHRLTSPAGSNSSLPPAVPQPSLDPLRGLRLRGVVQCRGHRIAAFETQPGRVIYVEASERIPDTQITVRAITENTVTIVSDPGGVCRRLLVGE